MILKQFYLGCLAHASYLIGDEKTGSAAVVDPQRDVGCYLEEAARRGVKIRHVILTHFHADFVAGHLELRERAGATIHLGARAEAEYAFTPMKDGGELLMGDVRLQALETPGHTPESISILVFDLAKDASRPQAVLTGDTLFVGDVGRPDLRASLGWSAQDLGKLLYDSLRQKLLTLPDETLVYPAHGAGSLCGKSLGKENFSTVGRERRFNYALQPMTREEFLAIVLAEQPDAPPYFTYDAVLNTRERATLEKALKRSLQPLGLEEVLRLRTEGAQILDVREPAYFEEAHLAGALNIALDGQYATWAGTVLEREKPIVLIADPGREEEAGMRLGRIGFDHVAGYLEGGMLLLADRPELLERIERVAPARLADDLSAAQPPFVLDVRSPGERSRKHIAGSTHIPLNRLSENLSQLAPRKRIVVHCATGYRSAIAASLLRRAGLTEVYDLAGGFAAWEAGSFPVAGPVSPSL